MLRTALFRLALLDLRRSAGRHALSALAVALAVSVAMLLLALAQGLRQAVLQQVVAELPINMVEVRGKTLDLGLVAIDPGGLLGARPLDDAALAALQQLPGVRAVYPKLEVRLPLGARGGASLFGRPLYTDLLLTGLPPALLEPPVPGFVDRSDVVPVVVSPNLVTLYNSAVAGALGTPKLGAEALRGLRFELSVGHSLMLGSRGARRSGVMPAEVVGISRHALALGASVPLPVARRLLDTYGDGSAPPYAAALVALHDARQMPAVVQQVTGMGYAVDQTAEQVRRIFTLLSVLAGAFGLLLLGFAALSIAQTFVALLGARRRELGIYRSVGASPAHIVALVVLQAGAVGLCGAALGLLAARLLALGVDGGLHRFAPHLPFAPPSFFVFALPAVLGCGLGGLLAAMLGALLPAWRAARLPITAALRS